jgi:hypothetical protein
MFKKFEVKVKYQKTDESGKDKMVSENYLIEGTTFGDVEETAHKQLEPFISGEFVVDSIRRAKFSEVFFTGGDRWFKSKVAFITIDEERDVEKRSSTMILVQADELAQVEMIIEERFEGVATDYKVLSVSETNIIDIFVLPEPTEKEAK